MPFRGRNSAAILCVAIAVFATVVSLIDITAPAMVLAPVWQAVPDRHAAPVPPEKIRSLMDSLNRQKMAHARCTSRNVASSP